jgi:hypothetical protein
VRVGSRTTPGVSTVKSRKLRPLIGRSETWRLLTVVLVCDRVASTSGTSAVMETTSCVPPTESGTSMVATAPTVSSIDVRFSVRKPCASTVSSYSPTGMRVKLYSPASVVAVVRLDPVAVLVAVTFALGTAAPVASVMVPLRVAPPISDCANASDTNTNSTAARATSRLRCMDDGYGSVRRLCAQK